MRLHILLFSQCTASVSRERLKKESLEEEAQIPGLSWFALVSRG
jgi:hypothetical protein